MKKALISITCGIFWAGTTLLLGLFAIHVGLLIDSLWEPDINRNPFAWAVDKALTIVMTGSLIVVFAYKASECHDRLMEN